MKKLTDTPKLSGHNIIWAMEHIKNNGRVKRAGWNEDNFIESHIAVEFHNDDEVYFVDQDLSDVVLSLEDLLAEDWELA